MKNKIIILISLYMASFSAYSIEISDTNPLTKSEIDFYSQSSAGSLVTCGVNFTGLDNELNYFTGSFSLLYVKNKHIVPMLKIVSIKLNLKGENQSNPIKNAWIQSESNAKIGSDWIKKNSEGGFLLIGRSVKAIKEGVNFYVDITSGDKIKIGYLHNSDSIDRVYTLKKYIIKKEAPAFICLNKMINQLSEK